MVEGVSVLAWLLPTSSDISPVGVYLFLCPASCGDPGRFNWGRETERVDSVQKSFKGQGHESLHLGFFLLEEPPH